MSIYLLLFTAITVSGWLFTARHALRLHHALNTDPLTGLPNRAALAAAFVRAARRDGAVGVLLLDLDKFKAINDRHGHAEGNNLLRRTARVLAHVLDGRTELAVRLHGDEFAVLLSELPTGKAGQQLAEERARAITAAISAWPTRVGGDLVTVTASIGAAVFPARQANLSALLRAADQRMYAAKATSHGQDAASAQGGDAR
ncbi:GGDEF domain-containing protein [Actinokineospora soli]